MLTADLLERLVCPVDHHPVAASGADLVCPHGHHYPVVHGVPVMLAPGVAPTKPALTDERARSGYLPEADWRPTPDDPVHPAVQVAIGGTSGYMYTHLIRKLREYPIPDIRLPPSTAGERLLDIGCGWGRWTVAAARKGYRPTGVDPDVGHVLTSQRVAAQLGAAADFVCADARYLPFKSGIFDRVFSYSVIQHFSKPDARQTFAQVGRVLRPGGRALVQMASAFGLRSAYHQLRALFRDAGPFAVRYWSPGELRDVFEENIGPTGVTVDCYFGLGLQPSDMRFMTPARKAILHASEWLRALSLHVPAMRYGADSLYLDAEKVAVRETPAADQP